MYKHLMIKSLVDVIDLYLSHRADGEYQTANRLQLFLLSEGIEVTTGKDNEVHIKCLGNLLATPYNQYGLISTSVLINTDFVWTQLRFLVKSAYVNREKA